MIKTKSFFWYLILFLLVSSAVLSVAIWFPSRELIVWMFSQTHVSIFDKLQFLVSLFGGLQTNFMVVSAISTIFTALLFGLNVALLVYYVRAMRGNNIPSTVGATSIGGLVSGFFGIGCASCGSILAVALLSQFGAAGLLFLLPFGGVEFSFLAVLLLGYSAYVLIKKIRAPLACEINK